MTKTIFLHYVCGHDTKFESPGILDPFGEYNFYTTNSVGEVHLTKTIDCYWCRKYHSTKVP